ERVGAPRGDEHRVDPERGRAAEDRPDVRVVRDVLEDRYPSCAREELGDRGLRGAVDDRESAAVQVEAREPLERRGLADEHRDRLTGSLGACDHVREALEPALGEQEGLDAVAGLEGAPHDERALRDVRPGRGVLALAQRHVGGPRVRLEAGVGDVVDPHDPGLAHGRPGSLAARRERNGARSAPTTRTVPARRRPSRPPSRSERTRGQGREARAPRSAARAPTTAITGTRRKAWCGPTASARAPSANGRTPMASPPASVARAWALSTAAPAARSRSEIASGYCAP